MTTSLYDPELVKAGLAMARERTRRSSHDYYRRLPERYRQQVITYYKRECARRDLKLDGEIDRQLFTSSYNIIATGYTRIVVSEYGAYLEIPNCFLRLENLELAIRCQPADPRPVKYHWWQTIDASRTKVYQQIRSVRYADYVPGMWYLAYNWQEI